MFNLTEDIARFLESHGFETEFQVCDCFDVIAVKVKDSYRRIMLHPIVADTMEKAEAEQARWDRTMQTLDDRGMIVLTEDRWHSQRKMMESRLLAHLEIFDQVYARNCEIRKIDKATAAEFLEQNHSYGDASCKYRYGMFLKRHTGHCLNGHDRLPAGTLVAVATFSNARKWQKGEKVIRSYEWTRYASLPNLRLSGGMGRMLKHFIEEVQPDDIMSYADLEWSEGSVYQTLGFTLEGTKDPVMFRIGPDWRRFPVKQGMVNDGMDSEAGNLFYRNLGSKKYRLKLTDYE